MQGQAALSAQCHSHLGCNNDDIIIVVVAIGVAMDAGIFGKSCEHTLCILRDFNRSHVVQHGAGLAVPPVYPPKVDH